jgi:hypothetical protein
MEEWADVWNGDNSVCCCYIVPVTLNLSLKYMTIMFSSQICGSVNNCCYATLYVYAVKRPRAVGTTRSMHLHG